MYTRKNKKHFPSCSKIIIHEDETKIISDVSIYAINTFAVLYTFLAGFYVSNKVRIVKITSPINSLEGSFLKPLKKLAARTRLSPRMLSKLR